MCNIRGSGHSVILLLFAKDAACNSFAGACPTGVLYLYQCMTAHTTASSPSSHHRYWAPTALLNSPGDGILCRNWTTHTSTKAWQHMTPKLGPTCQFKSAKNKRHEEQGVEIQSHTWLLLGQTSLEKALPNMHMESIWKQQPVSSCKTSSGECRSSKWYMRLFGLALWSLQHPKLVCRQIFSDLLSTSRCL